LLTFTNQLLLCIAQHTTNPNDSIHTYEQSLIDQSSKAIRRNDRDTHKSHNLRSTSSFVITSFKSYDV